MPTNLEYALRYRRRGFSVIPCKTDKKPLIKWEPYQLQKPTEDEIKQWWGKWPNANIAIVCGAVSGVDVLDVDTQEAYDALNDFHLPESFSTPTVKTPHGRHLYFKHKPGLSNKVRAVPGTDLRTTGGYVVAPPSRNGDSTPYAWFDGLAPKDLELSEWPDQLFEVLQQASYNNSSSLSLSFKNKDYVISNSKPDANQVQQTTTPATSSNISFAEGTRDADLFHLANYLVRGGMVRVDIEKYLEFFAANCNPPFPQSEIKAKIDSAISRSKKREINLTATLREFVSATWGDFSATTAQQSATISNTPEDRHKVRTVLSRLVEEGLIEKVPGKNGIYRKRETDCAPMDWLNADCKYRDLWLPLGLGEICGVQPGNVLVIAGAKDSGKTTWLLNTAKENRHKYAVHYFNSEMGAGEFKLRVSLFDDIRPEQWKNVFVYERSSNFEDVIKPGEGNLNIIDFLEVVDEFWKVAATIQKLHQKLDGALCIIAIQKNPKADLGRGGAFSLEKARLYVSLDYQLAKIVSCKNYKENEMIAGNPRGYTCRYKLVQGCKIIKQPPGWTSPAVEAPNEAKLQKMQ